MDKIIISAETGQPIETIVQILLEEALKYVEVQS